MAVTRARTRRLGLRPATRRSRGLCRLRPSSRPDEPHRLWSPEGAGGRWVARSSCRPREATSGCLSGSRDIPAPSMDSQPDEQTDQVTGVVDTTRTRREQPGLWVPASGVFHSSSEVGVAVSLGMTLRNSFCDFMGGRSFSGHGGWTLGEPACGIGSRAPSGTHVASGTVLTAQMGKRAPSAPGQLSESGGRKPSGRPASSPRAAWTRVPGVPGRITPNQGLRTMHAGPSVVQRAGRCRRASFVCGS